MPAAVGAHGPGHHSPAPSLPPPLHPSLQALAVRMLHVTCLPTLQLQRVEEFYGALLHEQHAEVRCPGGVDGTLGWAVQAGQLNRHWRTAGALPGRLHSSMRVPNVLLLILWTPCNRTLPSACLQKAALLRRVSDLEAERDVAVADARASRQQHEQLEQQISLLRERTPAPAAAERSPTLLQGSSLAAPPADVTSQLAALQQQLESLAAEGELPALAQERARMSICLRTIKEITDLVRQSASPSTAGSPSVERASGEEAGPREVGLHGHHGSPPLPGAFATDTEGESRWAGGGGEGGLQSGCAVSAACSCCALSELPSQYRTLQ